MLRFCIAFSIFDFSASFSVSNPFTAQKVMLIVFKRWAEPTKKKTKRKKKALMMFVDVLCLLKGNVECIHDWKHEHPNPKKLYLCVWVCVCYSFFLHNKYPDFEKWRLKNLKHNKLNGGRKKTCKKLDKATTTKSQLTYTYNMYTYTHTHTHINDNYITMCDSQV